VGTRLVAAVAAQDRAAIAACFAPEVELRALIPRGHRERSGAEDAAALISSWFEDSTTLDLVDSSAQEVADRLHVSYRFEGVELGEPYVVEQQLFCEISDGTISRADLLCSGFRPRPAAPS
jgi:ketosteroid isomerase-like protein